MSLWLTAAIAACCILSATSAHAADTGANCRAQIGRCEYYLCRELIHECGNNGYLLGFGYPYCLAYRDNESRFSNQGQAFMRKVRPCLQRRLEARARRTQLGCPAFEEIGFQTHVSCYLDAGFCDLPRKDVFEILRIARAEIPGYRFWRAAGALYDECRFKSTPEADASPLGQPY